MLPLPGNLFTKMPIDADTVRRLHADNPFFRARADRYGQLDEAIQAQEQSPEPADKYLNMLKKRRESVLLELVDLIVQATPAAQEPLWKIPPTSRPAPVTRKWTWP